MQMSALAHLPSSKVLCSLLLLFRGRDNREKKEGICTVYDVCSQKTITLNHKRGNTDGRSVNRSDEGIYMYIPTLASYQYCI
jgi:hypothetical protein